MRILGLKKVPEEQRVLPRLNISTLLAVLTVLSVMNLVGNMRYEISLSVVPTSNLELSPSFDVNLIIFCAG